MRKLLVPVVVVGSMLGLAACASQPSDSKATASQAQTKTVCVKEQVLGSHMPKMHCMTVADYKAYKEAQKKQGEQDRAELRAQRATHVDMGQGSGG